MRHAVQWTRAQRLLATFSTGAIVLLFGVLTNALLAHQRASEAQVEHTQLVIASLERTLSLIIDVESGQRGYLLTGRESYLERYAAVKVGVTAELDTLEKLTRDNAGQQARLDTLSALVRGKFEELDTTIALQRRSERAAALAIIASDRGKRLMDDARRVADRMERAEDLLLEERIAREARFGALVRWVVIVGTLVAVAVALLIHRLFARDAEALERALAEREAEHQAAEAARQAAEAANRAKSQFLAAVSHELRTPLNAIAGYVQLMQMEIRGPLTRQQREDLERIRKGGHHLLALINDILNFARVEAGQIELRPLEVAASTLLGTAEPLVTPQLTARRLTYERAPCDSSIVVHADPEKVQQILLNLLTNAIKFTDPGGRVSVSCDADAATVRIRITDTGRGIPSDKLDSIFEPFVQVDRQLTPGGEQGVGLGLAISRDLARRMGGNITATSIVGKGSTFTLELPRILPTALPSVHAAGVVELEHGREGVR
jgi:signal transduction histidine kinase